MRYSCAMSDPEMLNLLRSIDGRLGGVETRLSGAKLAAGSKLASSWSKPALKRWKRLLPARPTCVCSDIKSRH